jgi:Fe-only nitrogenase accessory protein AnfO
MNQIAVLLNDKGVTSSFNEKGNVLIFEKTGEIWTEKERLAVDLESNMENAREYLERIGQGLAPCKSIVCSRMLGIAYQIFDRLRFDIWEVEGKPDEFLEYILAETLKTEEDSQEGESFITETGDIISIDLVGILKADPSQTSKKVLIPVIKALGSKTLEVKCNHTPPWILGMEQNNEINLFTKDEDDNKLVTIKKV